MTSVVNLLQGFVTPTMVRDWYERYCEVNGLPTSVNSKRSCRRLPMPPIDFDAVNIREIEKMLQPASDENDQEPDW